MLTVTKEVQFDAAHLLTGHEGLCANLHGHTYKVFVEAKGKHPDVEGLIPYGPSAGMVIDFKDLKKVTNRVIVEPFDHAFIHDENIKGPDILEGALVWVCKSFNAKTVAFPGRPTAENMSRVFYQRLEHEIIYEGIQIELVSVTVYETPTSFAKYTGEGK